MAKAIIKTQHGTVNQHELCDKLLIGVTWEELTPAERWFVIGLRSSDYLYHTSYITTFRFDEDAKAYVHNINSSGNLIYKAKNQPMLIAHLRGKDTR